MGIKKDVEIMKEVVEHPERFCPVCSKRMGICKHTRGTVNKFEGLSEEEIAAMDGVDSGKFFDPDMGE